MKLLSGSHIHPDQLLSAVVVNEHGKEFMITGVSLNLDDFCLYITLLDLEDDKALSPGPRIKVDQTLDAWTIQLSA